MNSREKGKRGERLWRDELRAQGYAARRGQQFSGSPDSPDVVCDALGWAHFEVKAVERLNIEDAMDQARRDSGAKAPFVAHKRNFRPWLITMTAETFFRLLRGEFDTTDGARGATRQTGQFDSRVPTLSALGAPSPGGEFLSSLPKRLKSAAACAAATPTNKPTNTNETES